MKARKTEPTKASKPNDDQPFRIWAHNPVFMEDQLPWKCLAQFYYLNEALDYIAYAKKQGQAVIFQSPTGCRLNRPDEPHIMCA